LSKKFKGKLRSIKLASGLQFVFDLPIKGEIYTGWAIETGEGVFQPITYLDIKGNEVPQPTSSLIEAKETVKNGKD
jgi:hypothetical protein